MTRPHPAAALQVAFRLAHHGLGAAHVLAGDRLRQHAEQFARDDIRGRGVIQFGEQDAEFIAADAGDGIGCTNLLQNSRGDALQELVAGGVPESVVHRLELVQGEAQQREPARIALG